eukprot:5837083-Alexandrium_andersonii.AAC.1
MGRNATRNARIVADGSGREWMLLAKWRCPRCGQDDNFASRSKCRKCGAPRDEQQSAGVKKGQQGWSWGTQDAWPALAKGRSGTVQSRAQPASAGQAERPAVPAPAASKPASEA